MLMSVQAAPVAMEDCATTLSMDIIVAVNQDLPEVTARQVHVFTCNSVKFF